MLYETLAQPMILFFVVVVGFLCGIVFDVRKFLFNLCEKNRWAGLVLDFVATIFVGAIFFLLILKINYGEIRLWQILFFVASLVLERVTIGKLVAKWLSLCYNFFSKKFKKKG